MEDAIFQFFFLFCKSRGIVDRRRDLVSVQRAVNWPAGWTHRNLGVKTGPETSLLSCVRASVAHEKTHPPCY